MKSASWVRRYARSSRELGLRIVTRGRGVPCTVNGLAVRIDAATRLGFCANYEPHVAAFLRRHILPGSEIWNVGANVGIYVLQLAAWVGPQGRVLAFEPNDNAAAALAKNVQLNGLRDRVEIVRSAIAGTSGEAMLYTRGVNGMSRIGAPNPLLGRTTSVNVRVATLDEIAARRPQPPAWVVMDIEGWEIDALRSARTLLRSSRFVVELHPSAWVWSGHSRSDLDALLAEFRLHAVALDGHVDPLGEQGHVFIDAARSL